MVGDKHGIIRWLHLEKSGEDARPSRYLLLVLVGAVFHQCHLCVLSMVGKKMEDRRAAGDSRSLSFATWHHGGTGVPTVRLPIYRLLLCVLYHRL